MPLVAIEGPSAGRQGLRRFIRKIVAKRERRGRGKKEGGEGSGEYIEGPLASRQTAKMQPTAPRARNKGEVPYFTHFFKKNAMHSEADFTIHHHLRDEQEQPPLFHSSGSARAFFAVQQPQQPLCHLPLPSSFLPPPLSFYLSRLEVLEEDTEPRRPPQATIGPSAVSSLSLPSSLSSSLSLSLVHLSPVFRFERLNHTGLPLVRLETSQTIQFKPVR